MAKFFALVVVVVVVLAALSFIGVSPADFVKFVAGFVGLGMALNSKKDEFSVILGSEKGQAEILLLVVLFIAALVVLGGAGLLGSSNCSNPNQCWHG
jgi:hypothetical protein